MLHFIFSIWAVVLGLVTGSLGAFALNSFRFKADLKEGTAASYAYTAYLVLIGMFGLLSGVFNAPGTYILTSILVAVILAYIELANGEPSVSKTAINGTPNAVLAFGRFVKILLSHNKGTSGPVESNK